MSLNMKDTDLLRELESFVNKIESQDEEVSNNSSAFYYIKELANILSKYENNNQ